MESAMEGRVNVNSGVLSDTESLASLGRRFVGWKEPLSIDESVFVVLFSTEMTLHSCSTFTIRRPSTYALQK